MSTPTVQSQITSLADYILIYVDSFLQSKKSENLSAHSLRFYRNNLKVFTDYCESQSVKTVSQLTPGFLREYLLALADKHNAGGVHGHFRSLRSFLNWYWEEVEPDFPNPIFKVKPPRVAQEPIQGVTPDEFEKLLRACPKASLLGERDRAILLVLMDTGVRAQELCNIRLVDISLTDNSILITQGKGRKPRTVFMGRTTRKQLRKYLRYRGRAGSLLFTNDEGDPLVYAALRQILRRLCEKAGLHGLSPHDFRRAFTLEQLRRGTDLLTLSRLLGHTSLNLLPRYAKQTAIDLASNYHSILD